MSRNSIKRVSFKSSLVQETKIVDIEMDDMGKSLSPRGALSNPNLSAKLNNSGKFERTSKHKIYSLKRTVWRIFMMFSFLITLLTTTYTLVGLLYV